MDNLVSTQWLAAELGSADLVTLDASAHLPDAERDPRAEFLAAHIPGARFLDLPTLYNTNSAVPSAVPTGAQLARRLSALGIANGNRIVVYDDSYVKSAARAWFILRMHGIDDVAVLDGGLGKWRAEGRPLQSGEPDIDQSDFTVSEGPGALRCKAEMLANLQSLREEVVDARGAARFTGEQSDFRPGIADGHIPGSHNVVFDRVLNKDGTYRGREETLQAFRDAGVKLDKPVVTTCGGGVTAAVLLFALERAGKHDVALYDGSWSEWGADPKLPKELGEAR